jgi:hypothetical protein
MPALGPARVDPATSTVSPVISSKRKCLRFCPLHLHELTFLVGVSWAVKRAKTGPWPNRNRPTLRHSLR